MRAQIRLGRVFGVQIGLHYSWVIIAFLISLSLVGHFRMNNPEWGRCRYLDYLNFHLATVFLNNRRS